MQLEQLALVVRPRSPWEAIDLGFRMARAWARPVYGAWLAAYLPLIVAITLVGIQADAPWLALLAVWWLKPLVERVPLHVLSQAVFGTAPTVAQTLRALPRLLRTAPLWHLLLTRLAPTRAFDMPVVLLEELRGRARRERLRVLQKGAHGAAVWLTLVCVHFEALLAGGAMAVIEWLLPRTVELPLSFESLFSDGLPLWYGWMVYAVSVGAILLVGPLYVAAGFSLYLNRRTWLEAWDVELDFRRLARRLAALPRALAALLLVFVLASGGGEAQARAPSSAAAKECIEQVLQDPAFDTKREMKYWRYLGEHRPNVSERGGWRFANELGESLAWLARALLYLLLIVVLGWFAVNHHRWLAWARGIRPESAHRPPTQLFGLDLRPESLPADVGAAALALWQRGEARAALSLLYRGALSRLVQRPGVVLRASDTEGDCLRACRGHVDASTGAYFAALTRAWQGMAYAARPPASAAVEALCRDFAVHFPQAAA